MLLENKLYLGDCIRLMKKIPDKSISMILTDIPYDNVNEYNKIRKGGYTKSRNLNKGKADDLDFNLNVFVCECTRVCTGSIYIFCGHKQISTILTILENKKLTTRLCIWEKRNASVINCDRMWRTNIESCVFARFPKAVFNEMYATPVWRFNTSSDNKIHSTQKSVALFKYLIETSSNLGDLICDPCAGSMTTAIASVLADRKYLCIEKDINFYKAGKLRVQVLEDSLK